jgi:hypothetical protein
MIPHARSVLFHISSHIIDRPFYVILYTFLMM